MARDRLGPVFHALADATRRGILDLLRERPRSTGEVCAAFPRLSRFGVMKHLRVLADAGLVIVRARGRFRENALNVVPLQEAYERWMRPYEALWASRLLALRDSIESAARGEEPGPSAPTALAPHVAPPAERASRGRVPGSTVRPHPVPRSKEIRP